MRVALLALTVAACGSDSINKRLFTCDAGYTHLSAGFVAGTDTTASFTAATESDAMSQCVQHAKTAYAINCAGDGSLDCQCDTRGHSGDDLTADRPVGVA